MLLGIYLLRSINYFAFTTGGTLPELQKHGYITGAGDGLSIVPGMAVNRSEKVIERYQTAG